MWVTAGLIWLPPHDLSLLTQDDSLVQQMLASGLISPEQALHHPQKNVLTQHLGQDTPPTPHVHRLTLPARSLLLLCTDGLSNLLSKEEMVAILQDGSLSLQQKCEKLIEKANQNGGYDNITALLIKAPAKSTTFVMTMPFKLPPLRYLIGGGHRPGGYRSLGVGLCPPWRSPCPERRRRYCTE
ncbi:MAG: hypothetical protein KatS3mg026_0705 [Bacteroidia bacterium]|nr:MAG: hypothetical protein KatS3mg026_0705 [Bacteroidia bacterium]